MPDERQRASHDRYATSQSPLMRSADYWDGFWMGGRVGAGAMAVILFLGMILHGWF